MLQLPPALGALASHRQFMVYKLVPGETKTQKYPCSLAGDVVSAHDSQYWVDADTACAEATRRGAVEPGKWGVAFVLTDYDPFFFVDIDNCLVNGQWSQLAVELCQRFAGAAVEVSQSGTGLHIIGSLAEQVPDHACKNIPLGLECYTEARFIALTGKGATGSASTIHDAAFNVTVAAYFPAGLPVISQEWTTAPVEGSNPIDDDDALIAKAMDSTSAGAAFGGKAAFSDLWTANTSALAAAYPDESRPYDASSADAALAQHLAFWTGGDCARIERLMRRSALVRPKWDKHRSYMSRTICGAVGRQTSYYSKGIHIEVPAPSTVAVMRQGMQFFGINQVAEHFAGCVYIADTHRILTPNGSMLKPDQFKAMFGGYTFSMDDSGEKTTRNAWEAFTENQGVVFPKAEHVTFDPDRPYGDITTDDEGMRLVNAFMRRDSPGVPGDVSIFITHIRKLYGVDADILLDWIAVKVQNPGKCMLWAPVLIGTYGNGKTSIADAVASVIGDKWCAIVQSSDVDNKFNGWVFGNIFAAINDFKVGDKRDVMEILKPIITDRRIAYQKKGFDTEKCRNMLGIMITSNHLDAVIKTKNDRRYAPFISTHESEADLIADGMDTRYFQALNKCINDPAYINHLRYYFLNRQVAEHPMRAPKTGSTDKAISAGMGGVEQEIMEAIEEGRKGFAGGWVSSFALDKLLEKLRAGRLFPPGKRRELMRSLGYDWHPALKNGRVNNPIMIDDGKPRLFIKDGHIHANLTSPTEVARQYSAAQGDPIALAAIQTGT